MKLEFQEDAVDRILNVHKHVDGPWFWTKYSAHPYVGCRTGCEFCYLRGSRYIGRRSPAEFDTEIKVKTNAVEQRRWELFGRSPDVISVGDWQQPAEDRYRLSRGMLEVVDESELPLFIVERSLLLVRDLDLLAEINRRSWVGVVLSISGLQPDGKHAFEPRSPGVMSRLQAMEDLAEAGLTVGTALMPALPFIGDGEAELENVVRATKDHGGTFVLGGGLTMDGVQAERTLEAYRQYDPELVDRVRQLYGWPSDGEPSYGPAAPYAARLGRTVRELCHRHGLLDRMPRYIAPDPLAPNKRIAERLFLRSHDLELQEASDQRTWVYRKAAWTVDAWPQSVAEILGEKGVGGLQDLPNIGRSISGQIAQWLRAEDLDPGEGERQGA